jgi:opacity protein-like surface antigen
MVGKSRLLAGLASLTLFDIAAADAAPRAKQAPPLPDWTGFYIGAHAGYRWADGAFTSPAYSFFVPGSGPVGFPARSESYGLNSGIFGVHAGYNYLLSPTWLIGLEGDISYGSGKSSTSAALTVYDNNNDSFLFRRTSALKLSWQATIRGRLGYVSGPWLFYGTGGVAFIRAKWNDHSSISEICCDAPTVDPTVAASSSSKTLTGAVVGGGIERMFDQNWIGRIEYLYENFGDFNVTHGFGNQTGKVDIGDVHKLRVGISYKFGR